MTSVKFDIVSMLFKKQRDKEDQLCNQAADKSMIPLEETQKFLVGCESSQDTSATPSLTIKEFDNFL